MTGSQTLALLLFLLRQYAEGSPQGCSLSGELATFPAMPAMHDKARLRLALYSIILSGNISLCVQPDNQQQMHEAG